MSMEMSRLTRDGTAKPVSRDQILRRERRQGNINFPCSDDYERDGQPYPVDPYSCFTAGTFNMPTSYQQWVWEREANIDWSMVICQGSTRSELP